MKVTEANKISELDKLFINELINEHRKPVSAWYDIDKQREVLQSPSEVFYYAVYASCAEERRHWINEYIRLQVGHDKQRSDTESSSKE
jgi:hypothetical protein